MAAIFNHHIKPPTNVIKGEDNHFIWRVDWIDYVETATGNLGLGICSGDIPCPTDKQHPAFRDWNKVHSCLKTELKKTISREVKLAMYHAISVDATIPQMIAWLD